MMIKKIYCYTKNKIHSSNKLKYFKVKLGYLLSRISSKLINYSRLLVHSVNSGYYNKESDWCALNQHLLQQDINKILSDQRKDYEHYSYFYGYPYQSFATLGVYGERPTEERFYEYELDRYIKASDEILDVGCNCGFLTLYTSFRIGCSATGVDINPYAIQIGQKCTEYLRLSNKVDLLAIKIQDFSPSKLYDGVFSFATHWTDDKNYRVTLIEHLEKLHNYLKPNGYLFFESHSVDLSDPNFFKTMEEVISKNLFGLIKSHKCDAGNRMFYVLQKPF